MEEVAFGRYRLLSVIGEGGMGTVYKAHDTVIGRDVAIKVLPTELGAQPGYRERFRREAHIAARLTEPHIIPIHDTGEVEGQLYLVMPVIEGIDIHSLLRRDGSMSPSRAVNLIEQLAAALDAAHTHGLVHRDIKPSNALVTAHDFVYLIDFGIVHDAAATAAAATKLTRTGMIVGTWAYMAPERFTTGTADARADIYALACVLYECLTGATPYPGDSVEQQIAGHLTLEPPKPSTLDPAIASGFDEVIAVGMAKNPDQRYQRARELASAARHALTTTPRAHTPYSAPTLADPTQPALGPTPVHDRLTPPTTPAPAPVRQQGANPAATQQRPPGWSPVAPPQPADRRLSRPRWPLIAALIAAAIVLIVAAAGITYLLRPASNTPTAQPSASTEQTGQPATASGQTTPASSGAVPSTTATAVAGLDPFFGTWQAHTGSLVIDSAGTGHLSAKWCPKCSAPTENTVDFTLTSVSNDVASGSLTASSDSFYYVGEPVTATLRAGSPGQRLDLAIGGVETGTGLFCDSAAKTTGQCG